MGGGGFYSDDTIPTMAIRSGRSMYPNVERERESPAKWEAMSSASEVTGRDEEKIEKENT